MGQADPRAFFTGGRDTVDTLDGESVASPHGSESIRKNTMRTSPLLVCCLLALSFAATGCIHTTTTGSVDPKPVAKPDQIVQQPTSPFGPAPAKITLLNATHNFVVVDFSGRVLPAIGTTMPVYRDGLKVGEVRITEPVRGQLATADIVAGEARVGDEVR
jgi:hypothetical protein